MGELKYNEIDVNAVCFGILCNFQQFCGEERAKEAAALVRKIYEDNKNLIDRAKSAEVRAETLEKMVKEYQDEIIPGYREQAEKAEKEREEATKDCAVAKRNHEIERNRRKECETRIRELETQHRTEMCEDGWDCVQLGNERKRYQEQEESLKRALAAMWFAYENKDVEMPHDFEIEAVEKARELLGEWSACMPKYLRESGTED